MIPERHPSAKPARRLRRTLPLALAVALLSGCGQGEAPRDSWQPERPVTIVVPWPAGGSTDQVTRLVAGILAEELGQEVEVVNEPGETGSVGTRLALEAEADGHTWSSGSSASLGVYPVLGLLETSLEDWHLFLTVANVPVVSVHAESPYQTFGELIEGLRASEGDLAVATAGVGSTGHRMMDLIGREEGFTYRHLPFPGGSPAAAAAAAGEATVTPQLASEQAALIREGRLRPLAALSREPLELEGHGLIPPVTEWLPELKISTDYFGIWVRQDAPHEVVATMERLWREHIVGSEELSRYARENGAVVTPYFGEEARRRTFESVKADAWALHELGRSAVSPETLGIPRP